MKTSPATNKNVTFIFGIMVTLLIFMASACVGNNENPPPPSMANPAAKKCAEDGFSLKPVVINGVPKETRCINTKTGRECEVWKYFRRL